MKRLILVLACLVLVALSAMAQADFQLPRAELTATVLYSPASGEKTVVPTLSAKVASFKGVPVLIDTYFDNNFTENGRMGLGLAAKLPDDETRLKFGIGVKDGMKGILISASYRIF